MRRRAVDLNLERAARRFLVAGDRRQFRQILELRDQFRRIVIELVLVDVDQGELILRLGQPGADGDVLSRLHIERHPLHLTQRGREPGDHLVGGHIALTLGLERDEDAAIVLGDGGAARPDIADCRGDGGVAGSDVEDRLLALLHPVWRDILGRLANADNEARVLLREEALRDDEEERSSRRHGREHQAERDPAMSESDDQAAIIDVHEPGEERFERAGNPALLRMPRNRQQFRAQHGGERQRHDHRDQNRDGDGHGEFSEQEPDHAAHQEERDEHRDQRNRDRQDGEADLAGAVERGLQWRRAAFHMPDDVLDHDDGVVDDEAHRDRESHQGQIVETVAQDIHHREGSDDGNRHGNRRNDGRPKFSEEERNDADDQGDRQEQREAHIGDAGHDGLGPVGNDGDVDARGSEARSCGSACLIAATVDMTLAPGVR